MNFHSCPREASFSFYSRFHLKRYPANYKNPCQELAKIENLLKLINFIFIIKFIIIILNFIFMLIGTNNHYPKN